MAQWNKEAGKPEWVNAITGQRLAPPALARDLAVGDTYEDPDSPGKYRRIVAHNTLDGGMIAVVTVDV